MAYALNFKGFVLNGIPQGIIAEPKSVGIVTIKNCVFMGSVAPSYNLNANQTFVDVANNVWRNLSPNGNSYSYFKTINSTSNSTILEGGSTYGGYFAFAIVNDNTFTFGLFGNGYPYSSSLNWYCDYKRVGSATFFNGDNNGRTMTNFISYCESQYATGYAMRNIVWDGKSPTADLQILWRNENNTSFSISFFLGYSKSLTQITSELGDGVLDENAPDPIVKPTPDDPYGPGGNSGEGDNPPGTFDPTSDPIPDSPLPTLSMADTGFTRIYNPSLSQVQSLAQYLWKTDDIFETLWNKIKQSFENPMDVMIAFNIVPVPVPNGGTSNFTVMYIDTGVQLTKAANQFVDVDCGTLDIKGYYGSALDYTPYTKIQCYLPFIGMVNLDPDEVMNTTIQVKYRVDIVSGGCVAKILVDGNCLYQYSGHCSISVPFSASDFSSYMNAMLQVSALAVGAAVGGVGAIAGAIGAADAAQETNRIVNRTTIRNTERNPTTGRQILTGTQEITEERPEEGTRASFSGLAPANVSNTVGAVMASKAGISHAGSFNGNTGYLGVRYPYVIITTPRQCLPASYQTMNGYPSMITMQLGTCTGYTRVQQVTLTGMDATNPEQAEILNLLKGGVIF